MSIASPASQSSDHWPVNQTSHGQSHAKLILTGEHAVVYDIPGIAIPLPAITVSAELISSGQQAGRPAQVTLSSALYQGDLVEAPADLANLQGLFAHFFSLFTAAEPLPEKIQVTLTSKIPFERGMGSSAAIATAIVTALAVQFPDKLPPARQTELIGAEEKIQHGNPSGLDALVVSSSQGYYFCRGQVPVPLTLTLPGYLVIIDSGATGQTGTAIAKVAALRQKQPMLWQQLMQQIGVITPQIQQLLTDWALVAPDLDGAQHQFGQLLSENQRALQRLSVSTPLLDQLIQQLLAEGALGAKLTGGGLGGCVFGYFNSFKAAQQAQAKFSSKQTWLTKLG
ncbi:mevalonate kinase [Lapidilactobacillus luobeiensis]|uniref:mevalonate kinase n=1 Tax=Lapidilactobacillus luobeiensis TaxID=2950371 RepID=UPI0021C439F7|nr:mevalonate kinase [Lapidilactobacillus luobeiensis]